MISPIQQKIIDQDGNLIVMASAGTGKTHTMVHKIANDIGQNNSHRTVAAITFTIKAAQEIKSRLSVDTSQHFIGTNNSFAIEEVIKPFMKDVYGVKFDKDMSTDYSIKADSFDEAIKVLEDTDTLCSYNNNKENFIFELAQDIVKKSKACKLYLQAKYFKLYIDEYQDCDICMHKFFMYLCDELKITTFIVGDEKQSIYIWRGAYPEAFKSIWNKENFTHIFMGENFRSCVQIQNYSNLLCTETRGLYKPSTAGDNIVIIRARGSNWIEGVLSEIDNTKKSAILRFSNANASRGAEFMKQNGLECVYIPQTPIADITTDTAWLYMAIAKFLIIKIYSAYDFVSEIPVEGNESKSVLSAIEKHLNSIEISLHSEEMFSKNVTDLALYLGYQVKTDHLSKLYQTVTQTQFHAAFQEDLYQHIAITFHASKGLEFDQVVIFAEDYRLANMESVYNHYVAVTRAKNKLIIVKSDNYNSDYYIKNLTNILKASNVSLDDLLLIKDY